jgi:hypothetical protein
MAEKFDTLRRDLQEDASTKNRPSLEDALNALRRLRRIGEKLPTVDAAAIIREGRNLAGQDSR